MNTQNRRFIIPGLLALGVIIVTIFMLQSGDNTLSPQTNTGNNGNNGTATPAPGNQATQQSTTKYEGTDTLIRKGLTTTQLNALKSALDNYYKESGRRQEVVRISAVEHIVDRDDPSPNQQMYFTVSGSNTTLKARMEYYSLDTIHLYLFDNANKQVFDSGEIEGKR